MIEAGAGRIGTSGGISIVEGGSNAEPCFWLLTVSVSERPRMPLISGDTGANTALHICQQVSPCALG